MSSNPLALKKILACLILITAVSFAQENPELTPNGFAPIVIERPARTNEKLVDISKAWADSYIKNEHDVYDVTESSLSIDGLRENAFFYRSLGETFKYTVRYTLKVSFEEKTCILTFGIKDIYANRTLTKMTIADFFTPDGRLKEDYQEVKPSLEVTAGKIIRSYVNTISE